MLGRWLSNIFLAGSLILILEPGSVFGENVPDWVTEDVLLADADFFYARASGTTADMARANARRQFAELISTHIIAELDTEGSTLFLAGDIAKCFMRSWVMIPFCIFHIDSHITPPSQSADRYRPPLTVHR